MIFKIENLDSASYLREDSFWQSESGRYIFKYGSNWVNINKFSFYLDDGSSYPLIPAVGFLNGKEFYVRHNTASGGDTTNIHYDGTQYIYSSQPPLSNWFWEQEISGTYYGPSYYVNSTLLGTYSGRGNARGSSVTISVNANDLNDAYFNTDFLGKYTNSYSSVLYVGQPKLIDNFSVYYSRLNNYDYDNLIRPFKTTSSAAKFNFIGNRVWRGYGLTKNANYTFTNGVRTLSIKVTDVYPLIGSTTTGAIKTFTINSSQSGHIVGDILSYSTQAKLKITSVDGSGYILSAVIYADNDGGWENHTDYLPENEDLSPITFTRYWCGDEPDTENYSITVSFDSYFTVTKGTEFYGCEVPVVYAGGS